MQLFYFRLASCRYIALPDEDSQRSRAKEFTEKTPHLNECVVCNIAVHGQNWRIAITGSLCSLSVTAGEGQGHGAPDEHLGDSLD